MEKPNVQVIRFQNEDVIATSGGQPLDPNQGYFALMSEALQYKDVYIKVNIEDTNDFSEPWVYFAGDEVNDEVVTVYTATKEDFATFSGTCQYAWYAGKQWWTNGQTVAQLNYTYDNPPTGNPYD